MYCTDSDLGGADASSVPADLRYLISPFPEVRARYPRHGQGLGAANTITQVASATGAVGAGVAAGTAIAAGAAFGSVVPVVGTAIGAIVGAVIAFTGGGTPDQMKNIWDVVPFSLIRISGGHGVWTDTLTGQTLTDAQTDLRKAAVVASSINAFNDLNNHWYDATTQQYLSGASALQRWQQQFGSLSFANAYAQYPNAFRIFGPNPQGDPTPHAPSATIAAVFTPPGVPITSSSATPAQVAAGYVPPSAAGAPLQASILGGVSNTTLAIGALALIGAIAYSRRRGRPSSPRSEA